MKIRYYLDTDTLYIDLAEEASSESQEVADGVVVDYGDSGKIVGLGIDEASKVINLSELEFDKLPFLKQKLLA